MIEELRFDKKVEGYYNGTEVKEFRGNESMAVLKNGTGISDHTILEIYHPQCGHCHAMKNEMISLAKLMKPHNVSVTAINASWNYNKDLIDAGVTGFPMLKFRNKGKWQPMDNV